METYTNSQEHDGDSTNTNQSSNPSVDEFINHPSADVVTDETHVSQPQVTDNGKEKQSAGSNIIETGASSDQNESAIENENEVEHNGSSGNVGNRKSPEVLKEIQMQKTHDLYCPNCTSNITETVEIIEKGKETFPYNKDKFLLGFVIVISFKYPFIYIPWFYNHTTVPSGQTSNASEKTPSVVTTTPKKHVPGWLRFVLVVVLLLLSAFVLWDPKSPHTNGNIIISNPQNNSEDVTKTSDAPTPQDSEVVQDGDKQPTPPSPPPKFPSNRILSVIPLLLLAILTLCWPPISRKKITLPDSTVPIVKQISNDKAQNSTKKTEGFTDDKTEAVKVEDKNEDVASPKSGLSTPEIGFSSTPPPETLPEKLRKYIVLPLQNLLPIELDIVKSIVYGGLIESITSFGVVSSAAATGTSTLNVMALGLANLFSGFFLTIYNLYGLITYQPRFEGPNNDHKQDVVAKDPYKELLGKRDNYILHCFVVLISFIFFGVIPPLFYGFSFKITDKGHYEEAAVVVAASLVCVISLSFAKAYAFSMGKLKTVAVYTGIAIVGSALSFVASQRASYVFAKYDFHKFASNYLKG